MIFVIESEYVGKSGSLSKRKGLFILGYRDLVQLSETNQLVFIRLMEDLFMAHVEFLFKGIDNAVEMIDIAGHMLWCEELAGCGEEAGFAGKSVGQAFFQPDDVFAFGDGIVGDEYFFDLSGVDIILPF